ncbi:MAG: crosslink repair DNA glycosylase YcaQ family protein [Acidimicrobiia bacterium]
MSQLELTRGQILTFRRRVGELDDRLPKSPSSLRRAAWAGLQDSMPRAALLSIHARVTGTQPTTWEDPHLVQLWGPRFSVYVVAGADRGIFSLGRLPEDARRRGRAHDLAARIRDLLGEERMTYREAGKALGVQPNMLRYAAPTGTVLMRWEGSGQPQIWSVPAPEVDPGEARLELARRYLHVFGPATPEAFAGWAGIPTREGLVAFESLGTALVPVWSPAGDGWILAEDEERFRAETAPTAPARLLPSGDAFFLLQGDDRSLLVDNVAKHRSLWPSRVWPGAVLLEGEVAGIWRRSSEKMTIRPWRRLSPNERDAIEVEAKALPLPGLERAIAVIWEV